MLQEPLDESAPLAWRLASRLCRKNPATDVETSGGCGWLHGYWQILRLMGLAAAPQRHAGFYRQALARVPLGAGGSQPRVLISGTADYCMLAHVVAAFRARGAEPAVTVIDVCDTPLEINRWYARRLSCEIRTQRSGMLEHDAPGAYDAVCTHSLFGQFSRAQRPGLVAAWRRVLRPGGLLVTVHPMRPGDAAERGGFSPAQAEALIAGVRLRAAEFGARLGLDAEAIVRGAGVYAAGCRSYALARAELLELFRDAGFAAELDFGPAESGADDIQGLGGPTLCTPGAEYAHIIATRLPK